ncbi:hypothetical protein EMPS_00797 [Entomortierella parvispora]|uniref:F-box domain-containing protein n=1 Tax=Entomortierella parvispora TaxID=205924 RepID=A0A9P3H1M4_9FUNG|nr:hypothetical protein EMPS_00797 [Entomortierella parvispora]
MSLTTLAQHAPFVKCINCLESNSPFQTLLFPTVTDLSLDQVNVATYFDFIHRHSQTLVRLQLHQKFAGNALTDQESDALWEIIASCSFLRSLSVARLQVTQQSWRKWCWPTWSRLTLLRLHFVEIGDASDPDQCHNSPAFEKGLWPTKIRHLELLLDNSCCLDQLALLKWCPELESLIWFPRQSSSQDNLGDFFAAQASHCPKLDDIKVEYGYSSTQESDLLFPFLFSRTEAGLAPLRSLKAAPNWAGDGTLRFLLSHLASTLQSLELFSATHVRSPMVQDLLCSLPLLESFSARHIHENDVVRDPRSWVCLRLIKFHIGIWMNPAKEQPSRPSTKDAVTLATTHDGTHPEAAYTTVLDVTTYEAGHWHMFERLGALSRIQHFDLGETIFLDSLRSSRQTTHRDLQFGLKNGLDKLKGWHNLRTLNLTGTNQMMTEEDAWWMKKNWSRLETLKGKLNSVQNVADNACREILKDIDIGIYSPGPPGVSLV